uniref:Uncharacterized protein n=1 Tax=Corvus moneduloides TaxID=1196302 RepID=A0A8U7M4C8_CORMO
LWVSSSLPSFANHICPVCGFSSLHFLGFQSGMSCQSFPNKWLWGHLIMKISWHWLRIIWLCHPCSSVAFHFLLSHSQGSTKHDFASRALVGTKSCYVSKDNGIQGSGEKNMGY